MNALHAGWDTQRVNHSVHFMNKGACTNEAESYFSRLRRMEVGTHHQPGQGHFWTATLPELRVEAGWAPIAPRD